MKDELSLAEIVSAVQGLRAGEVDRCEVVRRLEAGALVPAVELARYRFRRPGGYARNLIFRSEAVELMVLCWEPGAASGIHDHGGQRCLLSVQEGALLQRDFQRTALRGRQRVEPSGSRLLRAGECDARVGDDEVHQIIPQAPTVSLHLYARPVDACRVFRPEQEDAQLKTLRYDSMFGRATRDGLVLLPQPAPSRAVH